MGASSPFEAGATQPKNTAPGNQASSPFRSGFGAPQKSIGQEKQATSPFGAPQKTGVGLSRTREQAPSTFGARATPPKNTASGKQGSSPFRTGFGSSPKTDTGPQKTGKQGASPFGAGFGSSPKTGTGPQKTKKQDSAASSPFNSKFGALSKQGSLSLNDQNSVGSRQGDVTSKSKNRVRGKQAASPFDTTNEQNQNGIGSKKATSSFGARFGAKSKSKSGLTQQRDPVQGKQPTSPFGNKNPNVTGKQL